MVGYYAPEQRARPRGAYGIGVGQSGRACISELPRIPILGTGVKIVSAAAHFHGIGVARQGPWLTWVNKGVRQ